MNSKWRNWGTLVLLVLVSLMPLPCLIDWTPFFSKTPGAQQNQTTQKSTAKTPLISRPLPAKDERDFLLKEHSVVTAEIRSRIEHEHLLFVLKFTVVGAVLGLIFKTYKMGDNKEEKEAFRTLQQSSGVAVCCWAAVAVAAIIDVRIFFNANLIGEAGTWVRHLEELLLKPSGIQGWEQALAASQLRASKLTPLIFVDRQLLTWTLYVVALGVFVPRADSNRRSRQVLNIAMVAVPLCFVLFWFVGVNFYFKTSYFWGYCGLVAILMFTTLLWVRFQRGPEKREAQSST